MGFFDLLKKVKPLEEMTRDELYTMMIDDINYIRLVSLMPSYFGYARMNSLSSLVTSGEGYSKYTIQMIEDDYKNFNTCMKLIEHVFFKSGINIRSDYKQIQIELLSKDEFRDSYYSYYKRLEKSDNESFKKSMEELKRHDLKSTKKELDQIEKGLLSMKRHNEYPFDEAIM